MDTPLVSCICITHDRIHFLEKSIHYFSNQTYSNKELIVAFALDDMTTENYLASINHPLIRPLRFANDANLTLGEKRNLAIEFSNGFYFCVWDDDDWYGETRIKFQVDTLRGTAFKSSALSSILLFDDLKKQGYVSATRWAWEGTLLCEKGILTRELKYAGLNRAEDSPLLFNLKQCDLLLSSFCPGLYIYVYHGNNTSSRDHWETQLLRWANKLSVEQNSAITDILADKMDYHAASSTMIRLYLPVPS
jgi:glycosyltransferase involved in cell wall biosynthesis